MRFFFLTIALLVFGLNAVVGLLLGENVRACGLALLGIMFVLAAPDEGSK